MTYSEVLQTARGCSGPYCKACPVCNGRACGSSMPGPGAKGTGTVAVRNYEAWQSIRLDLDTICENKPVDTRYTFFGQQYDLPVFAGPVGATKLHYGEKYDDQAYNSILVPACAQAGIAAFTGDGTDPAVFTAAARAIGASGGKGIPTVKPWDRNTLFSKLDEAKAAGAQVIAMDIDAAGLPFLKGSSPGGQQDGGGAAGDRGVRRSPLPDQRRYDREGGPQGSGGRRGGHRGIQPWGPGAGRCPRHGRSPSRHCRRGEGSDGHPGGRRHPQRRGRV